MRALSHYGKENGLQCLFSHNTWSGGTDCCVILVNVVRKSIPDLLTRSNKGYELLLYIEEETRAKLRNMRIQLLKNMRETSEQTC